MKLTELLKHVTPLTIVGDAEVDITGVNIDSRKVENGHLFVAMKGTQTDGHRFIPKAIELGAKAVLCEDLPDADANREQWCDLCAGCLDGRCCWKGCHRFLW